MKKFSTILAVLFTLATTGQAFAFDGSPETNAQVYFAIPFGAPSKAEATPRFGFSVDYGRQWNDNAGAYQLKPVHNLDFRLDIAGDASVYSNGVNLSDRMNALYAAGDDDMMAGWLIPLGVIGVGLAVFVAAKGVN